MRKSNYTSIVTFGSVLGYTFLGFLVTAVMGDIEFSQAPQMLGIAALMGLLIGAIVYGISHKFIWANGDTTNAKIFGAKSIVVMLAVAMLGGFQAYRTVSAKHEIVEREEARWNALTDDEKKAELDAKQRAIDEAEAAKKKQEQEKANDTKRYVLAKLLAKSLKDSMRDPDSFVVESLRVNDDGTVACVEYRAKNGFGGMNREFAVYKKEKITKDAGAWNASCMKPMHDLGYAAK